MVEIRREAGRTLLVIDGEAQNPLMYCALGMGATEYEPVWREAAERWFRHKTRIYLMGVPQRWEKKFHLNNFWAGDQITSEPLHLDYEKLDAGPNYILENDPEAYVMIRFMPRPPKDWCELHPEEMTLTEQGVRTDTPSLASGLYARAAEDFCRAYIGYCESRPWAERCLGYVNYHLCEGTHGPLIDSWLYDYSEVMEARWREFLQERYETVEALRRAWGDSCVTFENAEVPRDKLNGPRREVANLLYWQRAQENRPLRDWLLLVRDLYHENFRGICAASREAAGPNRLLLHDTLKIPMQGWSNAGFFTMDVSWPVFYAEKTAGSGTMDALPLLDAPGCDGLCTPYDYQVRGAGGIFEPEGTADSVGLRQKLFFVEQDVRTYAGGVWNCGVMRDLEEFRAVTWRDLASALTRNFMNYYCDHNADYFSDPPMHEIVARQAEVQRESAAWPHETPPGIAMILDDEAALETNGSGHVMNEAVMWEQKMGISRCGVPYRIYLLDDLRLDNFPEMRAFYFPNLYRVDEERLELLREKVLRAGNVVVWGPGSGISDGEEIGPEWASRLTGFSFDCQEINYQRRVQITNFGHPLTAALPEDMIYGGAISYGPVLYPTDGVRLGLAWSKFGGDDTGLAVKSFGRGARGENAPEQALGEGDWASVFTTAAPLPAALWREIARFARAHVYSESNDVLLADSSVVALHTLKAGPRTLRLPAARRVTDLITGELVAEQTAEIRCEMQAPDTCMFHLE